LEKYSWIRQKRKTKTTQTSSKKTFDFVSKALGKRFKRNQSMQIQLYWWSNFAQAVSPEFEILFPFGLKAILAIPPMSTPSESVFSVAGFFVSPLRSKLDPSLVRASTIILLNLHLFH